ncbi:MAG TPA: hypothetical protein VN783_07500 [Thermoanaerobaculia bacterium]|nr:hypothetical protein [Thermoanaerobaculia bacterium]
MARSIATLGADGRIALGERYAGRDVVIEDVEEGVWVVKLGELIPDSERWLHAPELAAKLDRGFAWAAETPPRETDLDELEERLLRSAPARP